MNFWYFIRMFGKYTFLVPLFSFILTILFEFIIVWLFLRKNYNEKQLFFYVFLINLFTWPIANLLNVYDFYTNFYPVLFIEIGVVLVESILLKILLKIKYGKSLLISFLANLTSFIIGLMFLFIFA